MQKKTDILKVLLHIQAVEATATFSQRQLAKSTKFSLTKVQAILAELEKKHFVIRSGNSQAPHYQVSAQGQQFTLSLINSTLPTWSDLSEKQPTTAVILAAGTTQDFNHPVALEEFDHQPLLQRTIDQLASHGITKTIIVAGFKQNSIKKLVENNPDVQLVINDNYDSTGTMASLAAASKYISDSFLLIEGDLLYDDAMLSLLLQERQPNVILAAPLSGSGDEAFVDFDENNQLLRISKDIRQMNELSAEMIGLSKLSYGFFKLMLAAFLNNQNQWLNYEYLITRLAHSISVKCLLSDNLSWKDIDNLQDLTEARDTTFPKIKVNEQNEQIKLAQQTIVDVLKLPITAVKNVAYAGGMTNTNYSAQVQLESDGTWEECFIRIPGKGTGKLINRKTEQPNAKQASELNFNVPTVYMDDSGIKITKTISGALTLSPRSMRLSTNYRQAAQLLKRVHTSSMTFSNTFSFTDEWHRYEQAVIDLKQPFFKHYDIVRLQVLKALTRLDQLGIEQRPCHNDLVPENFIKGNNNQLYLIDWEYSGLNDPAWDLAALLNESDFNSEEELDFLHQYDGSDTIKLQQKVQIYKALQDILWSTWAIVKTASGVDFSDYGQKRFDRAAKELERILGHD
ncbi:phosphotransferase [Furfurilactobacillus siliginis]|nr:NTP transferase domain-containing protein [Furfurilactobacillus siliginis]GEK28275.1 choline kinase [Furfurilactobacillus siliginis]